MPGMNETGPLGRGPRSGRGLGGCVRAASDGAPGSGRSGLGVGKGDLPRGGGRGQCLGGKGKNRRFALNQSPPSDASDEAQNLRNRIAALRQELAAMEVRLGELEASGKP